MHPHLHGYLSEILQSSVLLLGSVDTGKTTLARFLWKQAKQHALARAWLDLDPGQNFLGLPTTLSLCIQQIYASKWRRYFVGNTSPRGFMLPMLTGAQRLLQYARKQHARFCLIDTCGFITPEGGGRSFKNTLIELLRPQWILALQREQELEPILQCWEHHSHFRILRLPVTAEIQHKPPMFRRISRTAKLRAYFARATLLRFDLRHIDLFDYHPLETGRLIGLLDQDDFLLDLGIIQQTHLAHSLLEVWTPRRSTQDVCAIRTGRLKLNPHTGEELLPSSLLFANTLSHSPALR